MNNELIAETITNMSKRIRSLEATAYSPSLGYNSSKLMSNVAVAATTLPVDASGFNRIGGISTNPGWAVIDPYTVECEIRKIASVSDNEVVLDSGLTYAHSAYDTVYYVDKPVANVKLFGAKGNGSTDDSTAIQAAMDAGVQEVYFPGVDDYYSINVCISVLDNRNIYGDGVRSHIRHPWVATAPEGWPGAWYSYRNCFLIGNFGGEAEDPDNVGGISPLFTPDYDGIAAAAAGATTITFDTAADSDKFVAGDIALIKSGVNFTETIEYDGGTENLPLYTQQVRVRSVAAGSLVLEYPLNHDFDAASMIANADHGGDQIGIDGRAARVAQNVTMRDLKISMESIGYCIGIGGLINGHLENLLLEPDDQPAFGAGQFCYSTVRNIVIHQMTDPANFCFEVACFSNNTLIDGIISDRGRINLGESGSNIIFQNFQLGEGCFTTSRKHNLLIKDGFIMEVTSADGTVWYSSPETVNSTIQNVTVRAIGGTTHGFLIAWGSINSKILGCDIVASATAEQEAIVIADSAIGYIVANNNLGIEGARTAQDIIDCDDTGQNGTIENNRSALSRPEVKDIGFVTSNDTTETDMKTYTVPAESMKNHNAFRIKAWGNVTGTNDTKTIRLRDDYSGGVALFTITYAAGETGAWGFECVINTLGYSTSIGTWWQWWGAGVTLSGQGQGNDNAVDLTAEEDIRLTCQVANAADEISIQSFIVEQINDQWTNV